MKIVPVVKCVDLDRSLRFYTEVLDFTWRWPEYKEFELANGVADLALGDGEIQLSRHAGDGAYGALIRIYVHDIDARVEMYRQRGLGTEKHPNSPVHTAPVDQTWGLREFAFRDPDGNGILLCQLIP